jgi:hypothetical protein
MYKTKICLEKEPNFFPLFGTKRHYQLKNILNVLELDFMVHCVSQFLAKYDVNLFFFFSKLYWFCHCTAPRIEKEKIIW